MDPINVLLIGGGLLWIWIAFRYSDFSINKHRYFKHAWWAGVVIIVVVSAIFAWCTIGKIKVTPATKEQVEQLITMVDKLLPEQKKTIIQESTHVEQNYLERLKKDYELGYAMLYIDEESNYYYLPRKTKIFWDWLSIKIVSVSADTINIKLPDIIDNNKNTYAMRMDINRKPGTKVVAVKFIDLAVVIEVLEISGMNTIAVVGITQRDVKPKPMIDSKIKSNL